MKSQLIQLVTEIEDAKRNLAEFDEQLRLASTEHDQLNKQLSPDVLARKPDIEAIRKLASSSTTVTILKESRVGAENRIRQMAVPLARYATQRYSALRQLQAKNCKAARDFTRKSIRALFDDQGLELAIPHARLCRVSDNQFDRTPGAEVGYDPKTDSVHPDVSVEKVISESRAVEHAYIVAETLAAELAK